MQYHKDKHSHECMFPTGDDKQALVHCKNKFLFIILGFLWLAVPCSCYGLKIFRSVWILETYTGDVSRNLKCTLSEYSVLRLLNM